MSAYPFPDLTLPPVTILVNLLNEVNAATLPQPLTEAVCVFSDPQPYGGWAANTKVRVGTTNPAVYGAGQQVVTYNRIDVGQSAITLPPTDVTTVSEALAAINAATGWNLQTADIVDGPITQNQGVLKITDNHLIYTGITKILVVSPLDATLFYSDLIAPQHPSDPCWQGNLTNGVPFTLPTLYTAANDQYTNDPYLNFVLPGQASHVTVTLTDNAQGDFANTNGWLIVRRGQRPSANDVRMTPNVDFTSEGPPYVVTIPSGSEGAGEWYVSLDTQSNSPISGLVVTATWDAVQSTPSLIAPQNLDVMGVFGGFLGSAADILTSFFVPSSPSDGPGIIYWGVSVPAQSVLGVTLEDNVAGQLAAQLGTGKLLLSLSIDPPATAALPSPPTSVPCWAQYINNTNATQELYVTLINQGTVPVDDINLLLSIVPVSSTPTLSDGSVSMASLMAGNPAINVNSLVLDNSIDTTHTYAVSSGNQVPLADASAYWTSLLANIEPLTHEVVGVPIDPSSGLIAQAKTSTTWPASTTLAETYVAFYYGYQPFNYQVAAYTDVSSGNNTLPSVQNNDALVVRHWPLVLYVREVLFLGFTDSALDPTLSKDFTEIALCYRPGDTMFEAIVASLTDPSGQAVGSVTSHERVTIATDVNGGYSVYVYRFDAPPMTAGATYDSLADVSGPIFPAITSYLSLFAGASALGNNVVLDLSITAA